MAKPKQKAKPAATLALSVSRDIALNKLILSQSNVRRVKAGVSIEELAEDIARRTLLQSLTVRAVLDEACAETGIYEVPAGGRRFRALQLLVKQKRLAPDAAIPCVIRTEGLAEEDSLAENIQRAPLHPLDQFRAFQTLREKGKSEEEIAAAFFVTPAIVKQRLKLAAVAPALLDLYADDAMTLEQLMAFTVNPDHQRQCEVWEALKNGYAREPYHIRRLLTEGAVRATDKRARFVGLEAYEAAGGVILRDLFSDVEDGWLQDASLLNRIVAEKLAASAAKLRGEGWKWIEAAIDSPYGHTFGLRRITGERATLTESEQATYDTLKAEYDRLQEEHDSAEELPDEIDRRLGAIEAEIETIDSRPWCFPPEEVARAGAFVSLDPSGQLRIERGYVRPEDGCPVEIDASKGEVESTSGDGDGSNDEHDGQASGPDGSSAHAPESSGEDEGERPIPDRLMTELTQWRTVALRDALSGNHEIAFISALHAMCLKLFYRFSIDTCLELNATQIMFRSDTAGLAECAAAKAIDARHNQWTAHLPDAPEALWDALMAFTAQDRMSLFAHCIALTVNAVFEPYNRRPRPLAHADILANAVSLDMNSAGWRPAADSFFGRVTKARILAAVREAKGEDAAHRIADLKKAEMALAAEELMKDSAWLPEPLRTEAIPAPQSVDEGSDTDDPFADLPATPAIAAE